MLKQERISYWQLTGIFKLLSCLVLCSLIACSQEKLEVNYNGLSADDAVTLLKQSDTQSKSQKVLTRVSKNPQYGFDWVFFWTQIQEEGLISELNPENQKSLFSLSLQSCSPEDFNAFARTTLNHPNFHELVLGATPVCTTALSSEVFNAYFTYLKPLVFARPSINPATNQKYLVNLILHRYKNSPLQVELLNAMDQVSRLEWKNMLQDLFQQKSANLAIELVNVYANLYGTSALIDVVILPVTENSVAFAAFQKTFGHSRSLDLLVRLPKSFYLSEERTEKQWRDVMNLVTAAYAEQVFYSRDQFSSADQAYLDFELLTKMVFNLENKIASTDLLIYLDKVIRILEKNIPLAFQDAFFESHEKNVWTLLLKHRLKKLIVQEEVVAAIKLEPSTSLLYQLQKDRLALLAINEDTKIHQAMLRYCRLMELANVKNRIVPIEFFQTSMLEIPGCLSISGQNPESILTIQQEHISQSLSAVFLTGGASLSITASTADLSMIDLSSTLKHPPLPEEPPLAGDHAIAFPMVFGFRLLHNTESFSLGTYYVAYQFTWRKAEMGRAAVEQPAMGFSGGSLSIEIADPEKSQPPKVVSIGGDGQKAVPRRRGGNESLAAINKTSVQQALSSNPIIEHSAAETRTLLSRPRISFIQEILANAKRNIISGNIETFIDTKVWMNSLTKGDLEKIKTICSEETISEGCSHRLSVLAATQLATEIAAAIKVHPVTHVVPRLALEEYIERAGALGPLNPNGPNGPPGTIEIKGFSNENK